MRIISGKYKGRVLSPPRNLPVRPTTDFAKTGLFNILDNYLDIQSLKVLDLFAGTGNISFEFASRGAKSVTAVDSNFNCIKFIRETVEKLTIPNLKVIKYDSFKFITGTKERYDCVFADPPYDLKKAREIPAMVFESGILEEGGWLVLEHQSAEEFSKMPFFRENRTYGNVGFSIFEKASKGSK